jgi:hypothetical protein
MAHHRIPNVDFSKIPRALDGSWVVIRVGDNQEILASGESAQEALERSGVSQNDLDAVLTQVPIGVPEAYTVESDFD